MKIRKLLIEVAILNLIAGTAAFADPAFVENPLLQPSTWNTVSSTYTYIENGSVRQKDQSCVSNLIAVTPGCAFSRPQIEFYSPLCVIGIAESLQLENGKVFLLKSDCNLVSSEVIGHYDEKTISFTVDNGVSDHLVGETLNFEASVNADQKSATFHAVKTMKWTQDDGTLVSTEGLAQGTFMQAAQSATTRNSN